MYSYHPGNGHVKELNRQQWVNRHLNLQNSGGITFELKEYLSSKEVLVEYEKSDDINGATFEFSLLRKLDYLLIMNDKYVKIDLVVILGY